MTDNKVHTWLTGSLGCKKEDRDNFKLSKVQLTISVGQTHHEAERLEVTIAAINKNPPLEVVIMLDDSIQWRSLQIANPSLSEQEALALAIAQGDEWIERNFFIYNKLQSPYLIVRWKDWLGTPEYDAALKFSMQAYQDHAFFKTAIDANVISYLKHRPQFLLNSEVYLRAQTLSRLYCLEEAGVMAKLWTQFPLACQYEIYPCKRNETMSATYELWIKEQFPGMLKPITLRFNRKNSLAPNPTIMH